jgi:RNA polymerase sigma factor (sigma-70 family)
MATSRQMSPMKRMVRHLRRAVLLKDRHTLSDGGLLEAFLTGRDEAAFEILVKRHGPMVLGVCKRILRNMYDAEDAFQAVFLVLAKKAGSIVPREHVGNWLYGVAYRTALQARAKLGRRRAHELQVNDMPHPTVAPDLDLFELHQALDLELNKLPDKYRVPIVLCDLEARSRKDVARQLRIAEGTLSSRLASGRQKLAGRLARHGFCLAAGALASTLTHQAASAGMSATLVGTTVKAAALAAAGDSAAGLISAHVLALSQGVLKTMLLQKLKMISLIMLGVLLGGVGVGAIGVPGRTSGPAVQAAQPAPSGQTQNTRPDEPEPIDGGLLLDPKIQEELRLSKSQIERLKAVSRDADAKNGDKKKEIEEIQKKIADLQKQIAQIQKSIAGERNQSAKIQNNIEADRRQAIGTAAPGILSARAAQRVREIQRQNRGLAQLLQDSKVQRMLKINDEQWRKIEDVLKKHSQSAYAISGSLDFGFPTSDRTVRFWDVSSGKHLYGTSGGNVLLRDAASGKQAITLNEVWQADLRPYLAVRWPANQLAFSPDGNTLNFGSETLWVVDDTPRKLLEVLTDAQKKTLLEWLGAPYQSQPWQEAWNKHIKNRK